MQVTQMEKLNKKFNGYFSNSEDRTAGLYFLILVYSFVILEILNSEIKYSKVMYPNIVYCLSKLIIIIKLYVIYCFHNVTY